MDDLLLVDSMATGFSDISSPAIYSGRIPPLAAWRLEGGLPFGSAQRGNYAQKCGKEFCLMNQELVNGAAFFPIESGGPPMAERSLDLDGNAGVPVGPSQTLARACRVLNCILSCTPPDPDDVAALHRSVPEAKSKYRLEVLVRQIILDSLKKHKPPVRASHSTDPAGPKGFCCGAFSMQEKRLIEVEAFIAGFERRGLPRGVPNLLDAALDKRNRIRKWITAHDCGRKLATAQIA